MVRSFGVFPFQFPATQEFDVQVLGMYKGADKSLTRPGRKQATATEDFDFDISYL